MTLIEEEEIAVIVKKTLADALPISNTPGPVDVTGEGGFAALSLLYLDARGDLFIKEQQNQPLVWDGTDITIGPTNSDHITIDTTAIKFFKDSDTEKGSLSGDTWTLGTSTAYHTSITNTEVQLKNSSTVLTEIAGGNATIGEVAADKGNVHILAGSPAKIQLRNNTSVLAQLSSSTLTLGATTAEHISISGSDIQFYNAGTVRGSLSTDTWTLGDATDEHLSITDSGITFKDSSTVLGSITASELILGQATGSENNVQVSTSAINVREGTTTFATLSNATSDPTLRLEEGTTNKHWEFRKVDNSDNFLVNPETDSIFAFKDAGETVNTFTVDTTPTTGTGTTSTNNVVTTQSMGMTAGNPTTFTMGGTEAVYIRDAQVNMFSFDLANGQMFQADLTVVSWPVTTDPTPTSSVVGKYSIFVYRDNNGDFFPSTIKVQALTGVGEDIRGLDVGSTTYANTITISNSGSVWTVKGQYDFDQADNTRLVYALRAIGDFTKLSNLFD